MSVLVIGPAEEKLIADAIDAASKSTIPWSVIKTIAQGDDSAVLLLGDRKVGVEEMRAKYAAQQIMLVPIARHSRLRSSPLVYCATSPSQRARAGYLVWR